MRLMSWLDASWWRVPLLILAAAALAGTVAWLVTLDTHTACHLALVTTGGRPHTLLRCP